MTMIQHAVSEYIYSPAVKNIKNPLAYWRSLIESGNNSIQSAFAQMAIGFLLAPGKCLFFSILDANRSETAALTTGEHSFSTGGCMVSKFRHNLSQKSIHAAMVYRAWNDHGLMLKDKIIQNIKAKHPQWQAGEPSKDSGDELA